jgi:DNA-binding MarR family transcriptional regulator
MSDAKRPNLPIGYWLKRADEVLTAGINEAQRVNGLTRTEWQILNVLHESGPAREEQIATALQPFAGAASLGRTLSGLRERGLVAGSGTPGEPYELTAEGRRTHEAALALQKEVRQRAVRGISEEEYATTVRVLQQIVENLGNADPSQQGPGTHKG